MKRSITLLAALFLAGGLLVGGCDDDGSDTTIFTTLVSSNFPGTPVAANNKAEDQRAFTDAAQNVLASGIQCFTNSSNRVQIVAWVADDDVTGETNLYLSHMNGSGDLTPPVQIEVPQGDSGGTGFGNLSVLFLNTSGYSIGTSSENSVARSRNGDAIVLFTWEEQADPSDTTTDSDDTDRLFSVYFDSSLRSQASASQNDAASGQTLPFEYGFQTLATVVDNDPDEDSGGRRDVNEAGFISDSTWGSHDQQHESSGDPTTFVFALFHQDPDGSGTTAERLLAKEFALGSADTFSFPTGAPQTLDTPTGVATGEDIDDDWIAHNGLLLNKTDSVVSVGSNDDALIHHQFSPGTISSAVLVSNTDDGSGTGETATTSVNIAEFEEDNLFGEDHGLDQGIMFYEEDDFDGDPADADGGKNPDDDLYVATFDLAGALTGTQEIDEFTTESGSPQAANTSQIDVAIDRTGSWIFFGFVQNDDNDGSDADDNTVLKGGAFDVSRSVNAGTTPISSLVILTANAGGTNEDGITDWEFQAELEYLCGIQSDWTRMNVIFEQDSDDGSSGDPDQELHINGVQVDLDTSTPAAPTLAADGDSTIVSVDEDYGTPERPDLGNAIAYDDGAGGANVVFIAQQNNPGDNTASGQFDEPRVFHYTGTQVNTASDTPLSTDGPLDENLATGLEVVQTTPLNMNISANPNWAGRHAHILWTEERQVSGSGEIIRHAFFDKTLSTPAIAGGETVSFESSSNATLLEGGASGDLIGVYFTQRSHLWFSDWTKGGGWDSENDQPAPQLVDNSVQEGVVASMICMDEDGTRTSCDDLPQSMAFFTKFIIDLTNNFRTFVRVHN